MNNVRVLYVGGLGRSGSTLVDRLLGEVSGCLSVGELVHLWRRGLLENERCGCGAWFGDCPFWTGVGTRAFGGWHRVDAERICALQRRVDRNRFLPWLLVPSAAPLRWRRAHDRYTEVLSRVYAAIAEVGRASTIVDSSKHASTAALLRSVPGVDLRLVHLIRDPRGVAYSWSKRVERPEAAGHDALMAQVGPTRISVRWLTYDLFFRVLRATQPALLVRYEDLVSAPTDWLRRILALVDRADEPLGFLSGSKAVVGEQHTVSGNPLRFRSGVIEIRADEEWRGSMPVGTRRLVTALTAPARPAYGYHRGPGRG
jgi:Sulfotransferase family